MRRKCRGVDVTNCCSPVNFCVDFGAACGTIPRIPVVRAFHASCERRGVAWPTGHSKAGLLRIEETARCRMADGSAGRASAKGVACLVAPWVRGLLVPPPPLSLSSSGSPPLPSSTLACVFADVHAATRARQATDDRGRRSRAAVASSTSRTGRPVPVTRVRPRITTVSSDNGNHYEPRIVRSPAAV